MPIKNRATTKKAATVDEFIAQGEKGTDAPPPAAPAAPELPDSERWEQRADLAKDTGSYTLRYNVSQEQLLNYAAKVERRSKSQILAEILWPALEERYGDKVPMDS